MRFDTLPNEPTIRKFARQIDAYKAADLDPDMEIPVGFLANYDYIFNNPEKTAHEVFIEMGIKGTGIAGQMDQTEVENIGNNFAQRVKAAQKKKTNLPNQSIVDDMVAAYDFSGAKSTSGESMSTEERTIIAEIKKAVRQLISDGNFANLNEAGEQTTNPKEVIFNAVRVQTGPEAAGTKKDKDGNVVPTPPGSVSIEDFDNMVVAAFNKEVVEFEDGSGSGRVATVDFGEAPEFNDHGLPTNFSGKIEVAHREAARILERNRTQTTPMKVKVQVG